MARKQVCALHMLRVNPHELLSVCLMNWPPRLVVFVSQGRHLITDCVRTHCVVLTLLNCYSTFLLREGAGASKTTASVLRAKNVFKCVAKARVMIDVSTLSENGLPQTRLKNWQNCRSFLSILAKYGLALSVFISQESPSILSFTINSTRAFNVYEIPSCGNGWTISKNLTDSRNVSHERKHMMTCWIHLEHTIIYRFRSKVYFVSTLQIAARSMKMYFKFTLLSTC